MRTLSRRSFLLAGSVATLISAAPGAYAASEVSKGRKLLVIILRGAMDGLAALPNIDDPDIQAHRANLIDKDALPLIQGFALHSSMPKLAGMFRDGKAAFAPAIAGPYRERSHFAAQDLLESGVTGTVTADGWLNRALQHAPGAYSAVSIGPGQPLILRGTSERTTTWSPRVFAEASEDTVRRLLSLYADDPMLKGALAAAIEANIVAGGGTSAKAARSNAEEYSDMMEAAGRFLAQPDGPEIAVVSFEGWDTHTAQNATLRTRLAALDTGVEALRTVLGPAWDKTAILAISEFGRTVRVNGGQGTDHGTAGLAILVGGAVKGGRIIGDWPGLAPTALFENRDLAPTLEARTVFKGLLRDHLGWDARKLDTSVFPDSAAAKAMGGLV